MPKLTDREKRRREAAEIVGKLRARGMTNEEIAFRVKMSWRAVERWGKGVAAPGAGRLSDLRGLAKQKRPAA